jgi:serine/threonine protein kinase
MTALKSTDLEPIPGYRLVEPLGRGGFGEVWRCEAPGGLFKAIKFVAGSEDTGLLRDRSGAEQELRAFNLIKSIRHPFILSVDRVEAVENELVIVMELADRSLHEVLAYWQKAGQPGIPRGELLGYLREAAEALDVMNLEYGLQHLDIKPRNLFQLGGHVKVGDFGLVSSLADLCSGTLNLGSITPQYTAPESFVGKITLFTDQYSLAIAYHELLTGTYPFDGKNYRQLALQHSAQPPNLDRLPEADRPIVGRALAKDPRQRFASCLEFIEALAAIPSPESPKRPSRRVPVLKPVPPTSQTTPDGTDASHRETMRDRPSPLQPQGPAVSGGAAVSPAPPVQPSNVAAGRDLSPSPSLPTPTTGAAGSVVAGYQFVECVGRSAAGETWKARTAKGALRVVKLVAGFNPEACARAGGPVERLRALRHPALEAVEIVVTPAERLAIISNPVETTLADLLRESLAEGRTGVARAELLGCLVEAARCLDDLNREQQVRHLALTPRSLALTPVGIRILDFGLAELIWLPGGLQPSALNPRYTAPELLAGQVKPTSDQYSLALIYLEVLTGLHPLRNLSPRQLATQKGFRPDLSLVPAPERPALLRALSVDPDRRFRCCLDFIQALIDAGPEDEMLAVPEPRSAAGDDADEETAVVSLPQLNRLLAEVVARARGRLEVRTVGEARYLLQPGCKIEHQCFASLLPTALKVQLHGFRQQWGAKLVASEAHTHVFQVPVVGNSLWQRLRGRTAALQVIIRFHQPDDIDLMTPVTVEITPVGSLAEQAAALLAETGPKLLESVRFHLQALAERRRQERVRFDQAVPVTPVYPDGRKGRMMAARTVNLSPTGMRLLLPCRPQTEDVLIDLAAPSAPGEPVPLPARIVRVDACTDGSYDVGVSFKLK